MRPLPLIVPSRSDGGLARGAGRGARRAAGRCLPARAACARRGPAGRLALLLLALGAFACAPPPAPVEDGGGDGPPLDPADLASPGGDGGGGGGGGSDGGGGDGGGGERCTVGTSADPLVVPTTRGLIRGKRVGDTALFLGVPYAAPPVGALRFKPPQPAACFAGTRQASEYGAACPQKDVLSGKTSGSEDCLSLNVWTPLVRPPGSPARLPVLVFIHGGANILGASNQMILGNLYSGQDLAERQGAVVVSMNYRLGALGFLAHPALSKESPRGVSGNYALLDQLAALAWVRDNVAAFGGDPGKVVLFGESAGAFATCALLASPLAKGLFSAAIMESGVCTAPSLAYREASGLAAAKGLGCDGAADAACLRGASLDALVAAGGSIGITPGMKVDLEHLSDLPFGTSVDGWVLPESPIRMIRAGRHNHVPFIVGSNENEMELFLVPGALPTCGDYERMVRGSFEGLSDSVLRRYPCGLVPRHAAVDLLTDLVFTCPARRIARAAAAAQREPVYRYYFTHAGPGALSVLRAAHAMELPFVFHSFLQIGVVPNLGEELLSRAMQGYWARLATGDPNTGGAAHWARYDGTRDNALALDAIIREKAPIRASQCDFWDGLQAD